MPTGKIKCTRGKSEWSKRRITERGKAQELRGKPKGKRQKNVADRAKGEECMREK